jgi:hypothetical protein
MDCAKNLTRFPGEKGGVSDRGDDRAYASLSLRFLGIRFAGCCLGGCFAKAGTGTACRRASGLKQAIAGRPIDFSTPVLVAVAWPQPHMKSRRATFACLYDKHKAPPRRKRRQSPTRKDTAY